MAITFPPDYRGPRNQNLTDLLGKLEPDHFRLEATGPSKETLRFYSKTSGQNLGYFNHSIGRENGAFGYRFLDWNCRARDRAPDGMTDLELGKEFCGRHNCTTDQHICTDQISVHLGRSRSKGHLYIAVLDPILAEDILLHYL